MPLRKIVLDKQCACCGNQFNRKRLPGGRLEDITDYQARIYCGRKCYKKNHRGENHPLTKAEGSIRSDGYVRVATLNGRKYLHRVQIEKKLDRNLSPEEHVHHKDENKENNKPDNLIITTNSEHRKLHARNQPRDRYGKFKDEKNIN